MRLCKEILIASGVPVKYWNYSITTLETLNDEQDTLKAKLRRVFHRECWSLVVIGTVGNGKTVLCTSVVNQWNEEKGFYEHEGYYTTLSTMLDDIKDNFERKVLERFKTCPFLVIDEVRQNDLTGFGKETLQKILVERHANNRRTVLIANMNAEQFGKCFDAHVLSRLREGETQVMCAPDMRTKGV